MKPTTRPKRRAAKPPVFKFYKLSTPDAKPLSELGLEIAISIAVKRAGGAR